MAVETYSEDQYVDMFGSGATPKLPEVKDVTFTSENDHEVDLLSTTQQTTLSTTEQTTLVPDAEKEVDILGDPAAAAAPKPTFTDMSGYFEDRLKTGHFVAIEEDLEDGSKKMFIPKTPEEFDEVIDIQVNYQLEKKQQELAKNWYESKSPAWQLVAKYAEMVDDPTEIVPFLSSIKTIDSVQNLNPEDITDAEKIVRIRMAQRGEDPEIIEEQIEAFKTSGKLLSTAEKYKPVLIKDEMSSLQQMKQKREQEEQQYNQLVHNIRENVIKSIESPIFGKQKLKNEEKASIYEMIGAPSPETKGYQIYNKIDELFDNKDFDTLKQLSLFLTHKDSFIQYISSVASDKTSENLQRKLRVATDSRTASSNNTDVDDDKKIVSRTKYSTNFGRG